MAEATDYQILKDTYDAVTGLRKEMNGRFDQIEGTHRSFDKRLRILEGFKWQMLGAVLVVTFGFNYFRDKILKTLGITI